MDFPNPISFFDRHGWIPTVVFGLAGWWWKFAERGELLGYRVASNVLLSGGGRKLKSTWDGKDVHHLQIFSIWFTCKGNQGIKDKSVLVEIASGEVLDAELRNVPANEQWILERDGNKISIPISLLKPKEQFCLMLYMQHGKESDLKIESRSELKIRDDALPFDFTSHRSGYLAGWITCAGGLIGVYALHLADYLEKHPIPGMPGHGEWVLRIMGLVGIFSAGAGFSLNVLYEDWKDSKKRRDKKMTERK